MMPPDGVPKFLPLRKRISLLEDEGVGRRHVDEGGVGVFHVDGHLLRPRLHPSLDIREEKLASCDCVFRVEMPVERVDDIGRVIGLPSQNFTQDAG
jgi:hypothetical protein